MEHVAAKVLKRNTPILNEPWADTLYYNQCDMAKSLNWERSKRARTTTAVFPGNAGPWYPRDVYATHFDKLKAMMECGVPIPPCYHAGMEFPQCRMGFSRLRAELDRLQDGLKSILRDLFSCRANTTPMEAARRKRIISRILGKSRSIPPMPLRN